MPKKSYKYKSHTAITSIVDYRKICVILAWNRGIKYAIIARRIIDSPKQSKKIKINPYEVRIFAKVFASFCFRKKQFFLLYRYCETSQRLAEAINTLSSLQVLAERQGEAI